MLAVDSRTWAVYSYPLPCVLMFRCTDSACDSFPIGLQEPVSSLFGPTMPGKAWFEGVAQEATVELNGMKMASFLLFYFPSVTTMVVCCDVVSSQ